MILILVPVIIGKYLNAWSEAGGIAVKHEDANTDETIRQLEKIYAPYLNK